MRLAVVGSTPTDAAHVLSQLRRAGLFVGEPASGSCLDPEVSDLHRASVERPSLDARGLALPAFVGDDVWFRMRHVARLRDLEHEHWGFTDPRLPLVLGVWKYVAPDLRLLVTYREPEDRLRSWVTYHRALMAFVRTHRDDCLVVPMRSVLAGFPVVAQVNRRFGSSLDESAALSWPDAEEAAGQPEDLPARVQETLADLDELATPWPAAADTA